MKAAQSHGRNARIRWPNPQCYSTHHLLVYSQDLGQRNLSVRKRESRINLACRTSMVCIWYTDIMFQSNPTHPHCSLPRQWRCHRVPLSRCPWPSWVHSTANTSRCQPRILGHRASRTVWKYILLESHSNTLEGMEQPSGIAGPVSQVEGPGRCWGWWQLWNAD